MTTLECAADFYAWVQREGIPADSFDKQTWTMFLAFAPQYKKRIYNGKSTCQFVKSTLENNMEISQDSWMRFQAANVVKRRAPRRSPVELFDDCLTRLANIQTEMSDLLEKMHVDNRYSKLERMTDMMNDFMEEEQRSCNNAIECEYGRSL
jgi:hypothetical protein